MSADEHPLPTDVALATAVNDIATSTIRAADIPGLAIAVIRNGKIVVQAGYGFANLSDRSPVRADTRFEIGSITKQFTAACILQLSEAGRLTLDDRLAAYFPQYEAARNITVRQLLGQTSGIPEYLTEADEKAGTTVPNLSDILARVERKPLDFAPGTKWAYSNTNYYLLGEIVGRIARQSYRDYVRAHIFSPAGMTSSGFISDESQLPHMATGYVLSAHAPVAVRPMTDELSVGAGDIVSTVGDLAKWDAALLGGKIISPGDVTLMRSAGTLRDGTSKAYGFGWFVDSVAGHSQIWHNGVTSGFHASNNTYPEDDEAIIVLANLAEGATEGIVGKIFASSRPDVAAALRTPAPGEILTVTARVREWLRRLQTGDIDRSQLAADMNAALTPQVIQSAQTQFSTLGAPTQLVYRGATTRGTMTVYSYRATFSAASFTVIMAVEQDGKISAYRLMP